LEASITSFYTTYRIDSFRYAKELFTFGPSFSKFNRSLFVFPKQRKEDFHDVDGSDSEEEYDANDHDDSDHDEESDEDTYDTTRNKDVPSFLEALRILSHPDYHLADAYPTDPHFVKCMRSRLRSLSVLPLLSAHPQ
jgi:hypothetical protein